MSEPTPTSPRCPNCGNGGPGRGRSFCDVCGDFVDWDSLGRSPAAPTPTPRPPAPPAPPPSSGPSVRPGTGAGPQPSAASAQSATAQGRARELLVPLAEEVNPVQPGRPEPPRPRARPAVATEESGITCWNCGVGNRSDRRFCRNCGVDLQAVPAPTAPSSSSWRSRRPGSVRRWLAIAVAAVALAALGVLGALLLPGLLAADAVVPPVQAVASQEDPEHPPASAVDDRPDSWWGTGRDRDPVGASLTLGFEQPFDLRSTRIVPGVSDRDEDREKEHRPQDVDITVEDSRGREQTFSARLRDGEAQVIPTRVDHATSVTITVRSAYVSGRGNQVAISDIQFRGHRS